MTVKKKTEPQVQVHDLSKIRGELRMIGGSMSDDWNNIIANQAVGALWFRENADTEENRPNRL